MPVKNNRQVLACVVAVCLAGFPGLGFGAAKEVTAPSVSALASNASMGAPASTGSATGSVAGAKNTTGKTQDVSIQTTPAVEGVVSEGALKETPSDAPSTPAPLQETAVPAAAPEGVKGSFIQVTPSKETSSKAPLIAANTISVEINKAHLVEIGSGVSGVFVANPSIADVQPNQPYGLYVYGKSPGVTSIFVSTADGQNKEVVVEVTQALTQLKMHFQKAFPAENIQVASSPNGVVLLGTVTSARVIDDAKNIAEQFLGKAGTVVNNLTLSSSTQVYLKVKIAEVSRSVLSKINPNWSFAGTGVNKHFSYATLTGRTALNGNTFTSSTSGVDGFSGGIGVRFKDSINDYSNLLDMLDQEGLGTVLSEPNLVALSGQKASFLVGGEFPFPVPQNNQSITLEFKPFGIGLNFTPTVLGPDLINLRVNPEVSEIDRVNQISFLVAGTSVNIPSIKKRTAETSVELTSGQSFAIAGLLSHNVSNLIKSVPGLSQVPILGALFTSTSFQRNESELVIIVTPYIVTPTEPGKLDVPNTGLRPSSTLEMLFERRLNQKTTARLQTVAGFRTE